MRVEREKMKFFLSSRNLLNSYLKLSGYDIQTY